MCHIRPLVWPVSSAMSCKLSHSIYALHGLLIRNLTKPCDTDEGSHPGKLSSTAFLPVISCIKTTPNAYTSALVVTLPVAIDKGKELIKMTCNGSD
ncbi:hypothetical protein CFP56_030800 [Quercus suber]|uniref:Uncharacterized protein n=1 Tax=Quercus suber TaxID=58331 RepID=A0AAW0JLT2_QUESU